jgi:hypothetical protein
MFWKITTESSFMEQTSSAGKQDFLIVNRVEVLSECGCSACGGAFAQNPTGDRALIASVGGGAERTFFFCSGCGDNIMGRIQSDDARQHYAWDWAVPIRDGRLGRPAA